TPKMRLGTWRRRSGAWPKRVCPA
ncbi:uncharacterized protein METZ01_LOCUS224714, partial [marine metagenome]